jgi:hypothetical protein
LEQSRESKTAFGQPIKGIHRRKKMQKSRFQVRLRNLGEVSQQPEHSTSGWPPMYRHEPSCLRTASDQARLLS